MFFIGICGASCSGKSTLAKLLSERLGERCIHLRQDNYYIDQSPLPFEERCKVKYDDPDIFEHDALLAGEGLGGGVVFLDAFRREEVVLVVGEKALQ